ncbi:hypothetical protein B0H11DRAFT_2021764 [Mycena galericulata]|nr:hypothetical protein B0H11DRAFT_2021764 [Mycena galericulata]
MPRTERPRAVQDVPRPATLHHTRPAHARRLRHALYPRAVLPLRGTLRGEEAPAACGACAHVCQSDSTHDSEEALKMKGGGNKRTAPEVRVGVDALEVVSLGHCISCPLLPDAVGTPPPAVVVVGCFVVVVVVADVAGCLVFVIVMVVVVGCLAVAVVAVFVTVIVTASTSTPRVTSRLLLIAGTTSPAPNTTTAAPAGRKRMSSSTSYASAKIPAANTEQGPFISAAWMHF